jgi:hypothetical protein
MLLMMRDDGVTLQNMFALPEYANGFNNTNGGGGESMPLWGTVIDMGGETNACRPQFLAEALANTAITGNLLETIQTGANPTWNQPTNPNTNVATPKAHYLQSFAFSDGTNNGVIVFNLHRTNALPVTFSGAHAPKGTVKIGQLTSRNLTDNNEQKNMVAATNTTENHFDATKSYSLPPFSMTVFTWGGDSETSDPSPAQDTKSRLTASPTQITAGQRVTLTAAVMASNGTPDGTVNFLDGSTSLGAGTLSKGTATVATASLSAGTHALTVAYQGSSGFNASASHPVSVQVSEGVVPPAVVATTTQLTLSTAHVTVGDTVGITVVIASADGKTVPKGTVSISGSPTSLAPVAAVNGKAALQLNTSKAGTFTLMANFNGDGETSGSSVSKAVALTVNSAVAGGPVQPSPAPPPPPAPAPTPNQGTVSLALSTSSVELKPGQTSPVMVQVTPKDGFSQTVALACQGLPANVDCSFTPASLPVAKNPASTTMHVSSTTAASSDVAGAGVGLLGISYGAMLPWNLIGMLATAAARRRKKLGGLRTLMLLVLTGAGAMAMSGCGVTYNTVAQSYHVTLTATANGATVQTAAFDVVLKVKTAPW